MIKEMGKKNMGQAIGILLLFSGMVLSGIFVCSDEVAAFNIWTVNNQGGGNFLKIQDAINASTPGDIILVQYGSGTYTENILVFISGIMIQGITGSQPPYDPPTIQARNTNHHTVEISAIHVRLETLKITGASVGGAAGIFTEDLAADSSNWIELTQCEIYGNDCGVWIMGQGEYHLIDCCEIRNNEFDGIDISGTQHEIQNCEIHDNGGDGIEANPLTHTLIETSQVYSNGDNGIKIMSVDSDNVTIDEVDITNNDDSGVILYGDGHIIDGRGMAEISNNHDAVWTGVSYDVQLVGYNNVIRNYEVYQDLINDVDDLIGIYSETVETTNHYGNTIDDCVVHGYNDDNSVGVQMDRCDYMDGIDTRICYNNIGVNAAGYIDLHNYDFSTYNIYDNEIGANVIDDYYVVITHVYFYLSGTYQDEVGIYVNGVNNGNYVEVDDCRIERFEIGISIIGNGDMENDLYDNEINDCSIGIYVENGNDDLMTSNEISGCGCGIYLDTCNTMYLIGNTLYDNNANGGIRCGIYSVSGTVIFLRYNTITRHYKGVWFDQQGGSILECIINDDGGIDSDGWGGDDVEIGVYVTNSDTGVGVVGTHFEDLGYGIGVVATDDVSINGEGEDMVDIEYKCLYATCDSNHGSSGYFYGYGIVDIDYYVYLKGISTDHTDFEYDDLFGNWHYSDGGGGYSSWTTY